MRTKETILKQAQEAMHTKGTQVLETSKLTYHLIEALLDIRDILAADVTGRIAVLQDMVRHKGGD